MKDAHLVLVGICVTSSKTMGTYRVVNIYRDRKARCFKYVVVGIMPDEALQIPFSRILRAFGDAYAPWIGKIWIKRYTIHTVWYYQLHTLASPRLVGLDGVWRLHAQR